MKIKILSILFLSSTLCFAQEKEQKKCALTHAFGFNAGMTTGLGLSYQMYANNKIGFQLSAAPFITSADDQTLNFGFAGLYKLRDKERVDFLSYVGVNYIYSRYVSEYYVSDPVDFYKPGYYEQQVSNTNKLNLGLGLGFEYNTKKNITLSLLGGYGVFKTNNYWSVKPTIEASIFYSL
ncbi:MAG: hypothetical protein ACO3EE_01845 [Flavobacteriales bacterium]